MTRSRRKQLQGRLVVARSLVGGIAFATLLMAGSAMAADLPRVAYKAPPPAPLFSWTGFFLGGAQVGVNYQLGSWVMGAEAQFSWSDLDGKAGCAPSIPALLVNCHTKADWLGT